ncbi:MAG: outer membrane lipoprotein carrier protein LolA [Myxococcales bacterium]|nr:outer membrane lipoprotein carrier protein LolA [Myxococcales bacterium]
MIGLRSAGIALVLGAFGLAPLLASPSRASEEAELTLESLMAGMASARGVVAEFREVKELRLLQAPLESRGRIDFIPPDRLVRQTFEPAEATLWIDGSRVWFRDTAGAEPTDLSGDPSAREFVDNFVVIFSGDLAELQRRYETDFEAAPPGGHADRDLGWSLDLVPRDPLVQRFVRRISLRGQARELREMVLVERDGDRTTTHFGRTDADHLHAPSELNDLFAGARGNEGDSP